MTFGKVLTAMVTPYKADGEVDYTKAQKLALHLLANGSEGIVVTGTTGECPALREDEKRGILKAVVEAVGDKGTVIAGTTSNDTLHSIEIARQAEELGANGVLAVVPYYNKPSQEGIYLHMKAVAQSTSLPVILYNIPGRTVVNMCPSTVKRLVESCPNVVALKDSTACFDQISELRSTMGENFMIYSGDDSLTLPILALGGCGVISVASHLVGKEIGMMIDTFKRGDHQQALALHLKLMPVFKKLFITSNPVPVKEAMNLLGWEMGDCRLPLAPPSDLETAIITELLKNYGLL